MAARLRRELGIEVETVHGRYGRFQVLVDGEIVVEGGTWDAVAVLPSSRKVLDAVRTRLSP
jgi:hypothetical protein